MLGQHGRLPSNWLTSVFLTHWHLLLSHLPQVRAIIEAAIHVTNEGVRVHPHIMIPLVALEDELLNQVRRAVALSGA